MVALLKDSQLQEIVKLAELRRPAEAVGVIAPDGTVLELPNRSLEPHTSFRFEPLDIVLVFEANRMKLTKTDWPEVVIWHSHPSGGVGPSRVDMRHRVPQLLHLVVALTDEGPVPTWY